MKRSFLCWLALAGLASAVAAADFKPTESAAPFRLRRWTAEDGLPRNTVLKLLQTRDGYLWAGTRDGLARFDGVRFKVFTEELRIEEQGDRPKDAWPPEFSCEDLMEDSLGRVWVRLPAGLVCYDHGRFQKFSIRSGPLQGTIQTAIASRDGGLWIGTQAAGLNRFEHGRYTREYRTTNGLARDHVGLLREDREGRLWVGSMRVAGGLLYWQRLDPRRGEFESLAEVLGETVANVGNVFPDSLGRLWLVTGEELLCWDQGKLSRFASGGVWRREDGIDGMISVGPDAWWSAPPFTRKLMRFQQGHFETFGVEDGLADTDFRSLLWDREGNLWIGMGVGGLQRLRPRSLTSLLTTNDVGDRLQIDSVSSGPSGAVWLGTWRGLLRWQDGSLRRFTNSIPWQGLLVDKFARPVLEDWSGAVWFGSGNHGLFTLMGEQVVRVHAADADDGRTNWTVRALHEDRAGHLWIGSDSGLLEKRGDRFVRYTARDGLLDDNILGIQDAADGSLWVGTREGIHHFRDGRFQPFTVRDGLLSNHANPLLVEKDGTVWVGTPLGLNRIRGGEIRAVTEHQGLHANAPLCLLDDDAGHYWASSVRGIFRMRKTDLHAVADGRQDQLFCVSYGEADGAVSSEGTGGYQPSACRTPDGRMWFATTRGVVVLDPSALVESEIPPPVVIEEVLADDQLIFADGGPTALGAQMRETASGLRLPAGRAGVLEVRYTANSFVAPEKVQFRYRLEGADVQWRAAGTRRVAFYTNLRPGAYRFRVEASNREGTWSEQPAVFAFSLAPRFTQTVWFPLSLVVGGLGLTVGFVTWRLRWQGRAFAAEQVAAVVSERARIARDLHDDLGATLTGFALELEAAKRHGRAEAEQLATLAGEARTLAHDLRELAWTTNPRCDNAGSLGVFLGEMAERFCHAAGLKCKLELPEAGDAHVVLARVRHELLAVVKESLANVVKHAGARSVILQLAVTEGELRLTVRDDGRGFDPSHANGGSGLRNLQERFQQAGGSFEISSQQGGGTVVTAGLSLRDGK
ncbi:MAG: hypothetical protein HYY24_18155 [Verrucomicrobia bacterium]|nr:hypothetical protein [Verrucomicrobiota bacterium]